jgi:anti-anti-sigma regulatory factor
VSRVLAGVRTFPMPVTTLVAIAGEVDIATIGEFRGHPLAVPDRNTVLEMSDVVLSSAGLTVLLDLQHRLGRTDARVGLAATPATSDASHRHRADT